MTTSYERLSSLDASFLALETRTTHMHVAGISVLDATPLQTEDGGVDIDRIRRFVASRLKYVPRYRQRLTRTPIEHSPVWIDDDHFNLDFHVRHTSLPHPGTDEQLKQLAGRVISQQLDRQKPLWEMWVVEGLEGDRLALISKIHHAMIDGVAGAGIMAVILNVIPTSDIEEPDDWTPDPAPSDAEMVVAEAARRTATAVTWARNARQAMDDTRTLVYKGLRKSRAVYSSLTSGWLSAATATPLNDPIGPNRRFDWAATSLADLKEIRAGLGGTINDVVLASTAGAVRRFLSEHRDVEDLDIDFRVMAPVSVRTASQQGDLGNQVAMWLVSLPINEPNPVQRLKLIMEETRHLKETEQAEGAQTIVKASGGAPHGLVSLGARLATGVRPFNMTVTNVPGPQFPMYLLEAELLAQYPVVPLWHRHGVGVALFSYNGTVFWGLNGDWDLLEDSENLVAAIDASVAELLEASRAAQAAAEQEEKPKRRKTTPRKTTPRKATAQKSTPERPAAAKKAPTTKTAAASKTESVKADASTEAPAVERIPVTDEPDDAEAPAPQPAPTADDSAA